MAAVQLRVIIQGLEGEIAAVELTSAPAGTLFRESDLSPAEEPAEEVAG